MNAIDKDSTEIGNALLGAAALNSLQCDNIAICKDQYKGQYAKCAIDNMYLQCSQYVVPEPEDVPEPGLVKAIEN